MDNPTSTIRTQTNKHTAKKQSRNAKDQQITVLTHLIHRSALPTALSNRDELTLQPILRWLIKHIGDFRITRLTTEVALVVFDLYANQLGRSEEIDALFVTLHEKVLQSVDASQMAWSLGGMVDMLTTCAKGGSAAGGSKEGEGKDAAGGVVV